MIATLLMEDKGKFPLFPQDLGSYVLSDCSAELHGGPTTRRWSVHRIEPKEKGKQPMIAVASCPRPVELSSRPEDRPQALEFLGVREHARQEVVGVVTGDKQPTVELCSEEEGLDLNAMEVPTVAKSRTQAGEDLNYPWLRRRGILDKLKNGYGLLVGMLCGLMRIACRVMTVT